VSEPRDPTFLKDAPKPPPGPDPYRTPGVPRAPLEEPEPAALAAVPSPAARPIAEARPEDDPKEALFRAKLAAARRADLREAQAAAWAALGLVVGGSAVITWEFMTPGSMIMIRRSIPAVAILIPVVVIAAGYLVHYVLRRMQGRSP
jgi:hypothetical protein